MDYYRTFPFYMGYRDITGASGVYQGYGQWSQVQGIQPPAVPEDRILEDLEYLQQMYPTYAKKYRSVISSVVDKMDYDNSFIYDQYPDKLTLQRMVASVMAVIKANETADASDAQESQSGEQAEPVDEKALTEDAPWEEKEPWIKELVTVLMYYEILMRRRKKHY
ncbi:MAG: hypothetical protein LUE96_03285 [Lachnospiraceae bacterium]|nr:hypothetical protein [Lachnospiraceae bacterium]